MKTRLVYLLCAFFIVSFTNEIFAQKTKSIKKAETTDSVNVSTSNKKEEKNRNEMQNASNPSQPREINIGIPPGGDRVILENDVPVLYQFRPQIVTSVWKYDSSIGKIGLLSLAEGALTFGKVGFILNTVDREAGSKFKGYFSAYTNNWGSLIYSGNVSGPIGNKGWGYVLGLHETFDRGNGTNRMYTPWAGERMEMYKIGISKKYKNGVIKLLYKHAEESLGASNYQPLIYNGNGNFTPYPGFKLGQDSYTLGSGQIAYTDANTGQSVKFNLGDDKYNKTTSDAIYLNGEHKFKTGFKLTYASMYMHSVSPFTINFPLTLGISQATATNQYFLHGTTTAYIGDAQPVTCQSIEPTNINQSLSRVELTKKIDNHNLRLGLTEQYYATGLLKQNTSLYYQTVTPNPTLLDRKNVSNSDGIRATTGDESKLTANKTALYLSDDFSVGRIFDFTVGARIEKEDDKETHDQYANAFIKDRPLMVAEFKNKFNHVVVGSFVAKVTNEFGFLGDVTYNDYLNRFYDYPDAQKDALGNPITTKDAAGNPIAQTTVAKFNQIKVLFLGGGIYYNHGNLFSLVSKVTKSSKFNSVTSMDIYDPANPSSKTRVYPLLYDISTVGWTTDIITSPFKNFSLHFLITLQKPQYKNYNVSAFGQNYIYDNNTVPALSKVLMEIDPSYKLGNFKFYGNMRYYGKQFGNLTNSFYYKPWWENFAGVEYSLSRNCEMKLQVVNFLNQSGISGAMQGADQITAAQEPSYIGKPVVAAGIRPRTIEFTVKFKL